MLAVLLPVLVLVSCTAEGPPPAGDTAGDTGGEPGPDPSGDVRIEDAHNYRIESTMDAPSFALAAGVDDVVDWSGTTTDMQCQALDPVADIDKISLFVFPNLTQEEVEEGLANDSLLQTDLGGYTAFEPGDATEARLSDLTFFGTDADIETLFLPDQGTWLATIATGTEIGKGTRMLAFLEPTEGEVETTAALPEGCGTITLDVDLHSPSPVPVLVDGPWHLDWSALTTDGHGNALVLSDIDEVVLASFADDTLEDLEGDFFDLEARADTWQSLGLSSGSTVDLATLDGGLSQMDPTSLWLLGLRCSRCTNPAPLALVRLAPE